MSQAAKQLGNMTIDQFDKIVENDPNGSDYELIDGELVMMGNPTEIHEQIAMNVAGALKPAMDARGCRTYAGNMRVQASSDSAGKDKYKPDVLVRCGPVSANTYVTDPVVVVEVLSPSTMDKDRTTKLAFYKELPTVQHVVLAYTDQMRVEHYIRVDNKWELKVLPTPESVLELSAVEFQMDLEAVYSDVPFDKTPRPRPRPGGFGRGGL
jgi:Uma2 family endonuclease